MRPSRNDGVTMVCPICGHHFTPVGRQRVCSAACRQAVWRRRHAASRPPLPLPLPLPLPARVPRTATVYACPSCDARFLGQQRCDECGVFCRRVGPGGACPHCEEPVAVADLLPPLLTTDLTHHRSIEPVALADLLGPAAGGPPATP
jgi:hypothetical protein